MNVFKSNVFAAYVWASNVLHGGSAVTVPTSASTAGGFGWGYLNEEIEEMQRKYRKSQQKPITTEEELALIALLSEIDDD